MDRQRTHNIRTTLLACLSTLGVFFLLVGILHIDQAIAPRFENVLEHFPDGSTQRAAMYLRHDNPPFQSVELTFTLIIPSVWTAKIFNVLVHETMDSMMVNGVHIPFDPEKRLDLRGVLKGGTNEVSVHLKSHLRPLLILGFEPSFLTTQRAIYSFASVIVVLLWLFLMMRLGFLHSLPRSSIVLLFLATALATFYLSATPAYLRSHDWFGHFAYIEHLVQTWRIPLAGTFWQAHQPPLAYLVYAGLYDPALRIGLVSTHAFMLLQFLSLGFVIFLFTLGLRLIASVLKDPAARFIASLFFLSSLPLLALSSQVSNDVQLAFLGVLWIVQVERVRRSNNPLYSACFLGLIIAAGLLTKFSAVPWLFMTILFSPLLFYSLKLRLQGISIVMGIVVLLVGPFTLWRAMSGGVDPILNAQLQEGTQLLSPVAGELFAFNPLDLTTHPFIDFTSDPLAKRFLESLFRRSLILSSAQKYDGSYLMIFALLLIPLFLWGTFLCLRSRTLMIFPLIFIASVCALLTFRILYPYASSQHVRYIAYAFLPLAIILGEGTRRVRPFLLRACTEMLVVIFSLCSTLTVLAYALT